MRLRIKVMRTYDQWSTNSPRLHNAAPDQSDANLRPLVYRPSTVPFWAPRFHCELPQPYRALFWPSTAPEFWLRCGSDPDYDFIIMRIRIQLLKITRIRNLNLGEWYQLTGLALRIGCRQNFVQSLHLRFYIKKYSSITWYWKMDSFDAAFLTKANSLFG